MKKVATLALLFAAGFTHAAGYDKPGFVTKVENGRLWVFATGSKELAEFEKNGEPTIAISRIGEGPEGMTLRGANPEVLEAYLAAK